MNLLPKVKRVYSQLLGPSEEEIQRCKVNFREDRLKSILDGEEFIFDEERHSPKTVLDIKPISQPMNTLMYVDYSYTTSGIEPLPSNYYKRKRKNRYINNELIELTRSNIKSQIRESKLRYILRDKEGK